MTGALGVAFTTHILLAIGFYQGGAIFGKGGGSGIHGPFHLGNYVIPALLFAAPGIWFCAALAFAVGERTRRPMAVYAVPTALFVLTLTLLWTWNPPGLDPRVDRLLQVLDPTALRWLGQTLFKVDRGVELYNTAPLALDGTLVLNRLVALVLPALAVLASVRHFRRSRRGPRAERLHRQLRGGEDRGAARRRPDHGGLGKRSPRGSAERDRGPVGRPAPGRHRGVLPSRTSLQRGRDPGYPGRGAGAVFRVVPSLSMAGAAAERIP